MEGLITATEVRERVRQLDLGPWPQIHARVRQHRTTDAFFSDMVMELLDVHTDLLEGAGELIEWEGR